MKRNITVSVEDTNYLMALNNLGKGNISKYIDECLAATGRKEINNNSDLIEELKELEKTQLNAQIRIGIINNEIQSNKEQDALKAKESLENEQFKRWQCPVCKHKNFMESIRCDGCSMKTREDKRTEIISIKGD